MTKYGDYIIEYDPQIVPGFNYSWAHKDFDGAPDADDFRCGWASTIEEAKEFIDGLEGE